MSKRNGHAAPAAPAQNASELLNVPFLGETRVLALAAAGIHTLADLRAAAPAQIGGVKGVGIGNAARIKNWLATQDQATTEPSASDTSLDPQLASVNQSIFDDLTNMNEIVPRLTQMIPKKSLDKKLARQLDRLLVITSAMHERLDTVKAKRMQQAVKVVDEVVKLLDKTVSTGKLSEKRQGKLGETLRERRKRLEKLVA